MKFSTKKLQKGFTLIELLIVAAIIAMLATLVLTSLSRARQSAADASAQGQAQVLRTEAELHAMDNGDYSTLCASANVAPLLQKIIDDSAEPAASANNDFDAICNSGANGYKVQFTLNRADGANTDYCIDATGAAMTTANAIAATLECS